MKEEKNKLSQELVTLASLNNKLSGELEMLKSQDKRLKDKLSTMETALDKVLLGVYAPLPRTKRSSGDCNTMMATE